MALVPDPFRFDREVRAELMALLNNAIESPDWRPGSGVRRALEEMEELVYREMSAGDDPPLRSARDVLSDLEDAIDTVRDAVLAVRENELATDLVNQARARLGETEPFFEEALAILRRWDNIFSAYAGGPDPRAKPPLDASETVFDAATRPALWQIFAAKGQSSILDQTKPLNPKGGRPRKTRRDRILLQVAKILEHQGVPRPHREAGVLVQVLPYALEAVGERMPDDVRQILAQVNDDDWRTGKRTEG